MAGYLVVFTEDNTVQSGLYDDSLQYISDIDLDSEEAYEHLSQAEEMTNLDDDMWDPILGDLTPEQRKEAKVYRLNEEVINERDAEIEGQMQENDDELPYGYNG
jgi:hypothetical protein